MKIKTLSLGALSTNCYIIEDETAQKCAVIDPADNARKILSETEIKGIKIEKIILTHVHFDHMLALPELYEKTGAQVVMGQYDAPALSHPVLNLSAAFTGEGFTFISATTLFLPQPVRAIIQPNGVPLYLVSGRSSGVFPFRSKFLQSSSSMSI